MKLINSVAKERRSVSVDLAYQHSAGTGHHGASKTQQTESTHPKEHKPDETFVTRYAELDAVNVT